MYCYACKSVKAGSGCYMPGSTVRICLDCFLGRQGTMPLPSNAPEVLGGAFADAKRLVEAKAYEAGQETRKKMNRAGKAIVAGVAGFREWRDEKKNEFREAREAFWKEMPEEIQEARNQANQEINKFVNPVQEKIRENEDGLLDRADKLFNDLF